jgi:hypothetical protein
MFEVRVEVEAPAKAFAVSQRDFPMDPAAARAVPRFLYLEAIFE